MKTALTLLVTLLISISNLAQNGINYKAIIKDGGGNAVVNELIQVQFSILQGVALTSIYFETHAPTTDANGVVILNIGEGISIDDFDLIDWGSDDHFLNVQVNAGSGLIDLGTTQFKTVPYALTADNALNVTGLEAIDEGNGQGWRLKAKDAVYYGNIGHNATDLSNSTTLSTAHGAIGNSSVATGENTSASGLNSSAFGNGTLASGSNATSMGFNSSATGIYSTAMGFNAMAIGGTSVSMGSGTVASGAFSVALGGNTTASEFSATAMGNLTTASGEYATSMGLQTNAHSYGSVAMGRFNMGLGNPTSWVASDPLFEVGNGNNVGSESNALTVLKNGNVGIGTHNPQELLHVSGILRIGSETIEDTGNNQLSFNASLLPDIDDAMNLGNASARWNAVWAVDGTINTSDRRDKENITDLNYGIKEIQKLKPVSFNWKKRPEAGAKLGLIAQDLQKIIPEVVMSEEIVYSSEGEMAYKKKPLDRLGVYYSDLIPVLIKAIQEQQIIIDNEKSKNAKQSLQLEALLSRIENLESNTSN